MRRGRLAIRAKCFDRRTNHPPPSSLDAFTSPAVVGIVHSNISRTPTTTSNPERSSSGSWRSCCGSTTRSPTKWGGIRKIGRRSSFAYCGSCDLPRSRRGHSFLTGARPFSWDSVVDWGGEIAWIRPTHRKPPKTRSRPNSARRRSGSWKSIPDFPGEHPTPSRRVESSFGTVAFRGSTTCSRRSMD